MRGREGGGGEREGGRRRGGEGARDRIRREVGAAARHARKKRPPTRSGAFNPLQHTCIHHHYYTTSTTTTKTALWVLIAATIRAFRPVIGDAALWLLGPYLAWVTFAAALTVWIWHHNPALGKQVRGGEGGRLLRRGEATRGGRIVRERGGERDSARAALIAQSNSSLRLPLAPLAPHAKQPRGPPCTATQQRQQADARRAGALARACGVSTPPPAALLGALLSALKDAPLRDQPALPLGAETLPNASARHPGPTPFDSFSRRHPFLLDALTAAAERRCTADCLAKANCAVRACVRR